MQCADSNFKIVKTGYTNLKMKIWKQHTQFNVMLGAFVQAFPHSSGVARRHLTESASGSSAGMLITVVQPNCTLRENGGQVPFVIYIFIFTKIWAKAPDVILFSYYIVHNNTLGGGGLNGFQQFTLMLPVQQIWDWHSAPQCRYVFQNQKQLPSFPALTTGLTLHIPIIWIGK